MKTVVKFELKHEEVEIGYKRFGATYQHGDVACCRVWNRNTCDPEVLAVFENEKEALQNLSGYRSGTRETQGLLGTLLFAEEYWVEKNQYYEDEDGELEFDQGGDIVEIAPL